MTSGASGGVARRGWRALWLISAGAFAACANDAPWWSRDAFRISADFRADSTCSATLDGVPLAPGTAHQDYGHPLALPGEPPRRDRQDTYFCRELQLTFTVSQAQALGPGIYHIGRHAHGVGLQIEGSLFSDDIPTGGWPFAFGGVYLDADSGSIALTRIEPYLLVGHVEFRARRRVKGIG